MPSTEYWTADDIDKLLGIMASHECTHMELGDLKLTRQPKIEFPGITADGKEPSDEEILDDPYAGLRE